MERKEGEDQGVIDVGVKAKEERVQMWADGRLLSSICVNGLRQ